MARLMSALSEVFGPNYQHVATWIQTLVVVFGVIVANLQLGAMVDQNDLSRRKAYHDLSEEYRGNLQQPIFDLEGAVIRAGNANTSGQEMKDEFAASNPQEILKKYVELLVRMETCGDDRVCNRSQTSAFVCRHAKRTWSALNYHQNEIRFAPWKSLEMQKYSWDLNDLIASECSYFDAVWFRVSSDIF